MPEETKKTWIRRNMVEICYLHSEAIRVNENVSAFAEIKLLVTPSQNYMLGSIELTDSNQGKRCFKDTFTSIEDCKNWFVKKAFEFKYITRLNTK